MTKLAEATVDETPSQLAEVHARASHTCELCGVRNFAIGGRDASGNFHPLFQSRPDPLEARARLGRWGMCGVNGPERAFKVIRIVCQFVVVTDEDSSTPMLLCERCIAKIRKKERVRVEVAA